MSNISLLELKRGTKVMNTVKVIKDTKNNSSKKSKENIITMMEKNMLVVILAQQLILIQRYLMY